MIIEIRRESTVSKTYKSERARGLFNVSEEDGASFALDAELPLEDPRWRIGIVVGSSGSGKSSIGTELLGLGWNMWTGGYDAWGEGTVLDEVGDGDFDAITGVLSQVGLGSVPAWLRPYRVLSNGERFRADLAKLLLTNDRHIVIDEFTSVLDRTVAKIGAQAFARAWRKKGARRAILLTCHHDVLPWIEPDWVFDTDRRRLWVTDDLHDRVVPPGREQYPEVGRLVIKK